MHGLPADFDGGMLRGRALEQICFNQNQVALHFDNDVGIVIESSFLHQTEDRLSTQRAVHVPVSTSDLMGLLGSSVTAASGAHADSGLR